MKANDLRKGNIVYNGYEGGNEILSAFQISQIEVMNNGGNVADYYRSLEYIPLTEEWLFKLGFEVSDDYGGSWLSPTGSYGSTIRILRAVNIKTFLWQYSDYNNVKIKYVHQLQNLYFALTGEELIIK